MCKLFTVITRENISTQITPSPCVYSPLNCYTIVQFYIHVNNVEVTVNTSTYIQMCTVITTNQPIRWYIIIIAQVTRDFWLLANKLHPQAMPSDSVLLLS